MKKDFTLDKAKELIDYSLSEFYKNDSALLDYKSIKDTVAENCMVFRIGWYMLSKINDDQFYYDVSLDCQYNRNFEHPKGLFKQTEEGIRVKTKNAIPDLLLHKRGSNSDNLMVLEFKKGKPSKDQMDIDAEKLCYYTSSENEYKYLLGFAIWLYKKNKAAVKVFENGKEMGSLCYKWTLDLRRK